jgi:hypothetical protein
MKKKLGKNTDILKKNQIEIMEIKISISQIKNSVESLFL